MKRHAAVSFLFVLVLGHTVSLLRAENPLPMNERVQFYAELYSGKSGDMVQSLLNHRASARLDGSMESLVYVDNHVLAVSGKIYTQGIEDIDPNEFQQFVRGASAYVSSALLGTNGTFVLESYPAAKPDGWGVGLGLGVVVKDQMGRVFLTDCVVLDLLLGLTERRIREAARGFLVSGTQPRCYLLETQT